VGSREKVRVMEWEEWGVRVEVVRRVGGEGCGCR
jgi:hypothetical protein